MKEFKGTKGEWKVGNSDTHNYIYNNASDDPFRNFTIANCDNDGIQKKEAKENAKLIAAAPELLKALQGIIGQVHNEHCSEYMDEYLIKSEEAINKALN